MKQGTKVLYAGYVHYVVKVMDWDQNIVHISRNGRDTADSACVSISDLQVIE